MQYIYICRNNYFMRKNIDIDEKVLTKLKISPVFEEMSVKSLMEKVASIFVDEKKIKCIVRRRKRGFGFVAFNAAIL